MTTNDIKETINIWNEWANKPEVKRYDIALFKIWIQFEQFLAELFVAYATGNPSEKNFYPNLKICFNDEAHLNAFLREGNKKYIEYLDKIEKLSKHIFNKDPFDIIFADSINKNAFEQMKSIRNYIAHESGEAKAKLINKCFSGNSNNFLEPNEFLLRKEPSSKNTYYTYYTDIIKNIVDLLVDPPE